MTRTRPPNLIPDSSLSLSLMHSNFRSLETAVDHRVLVRYADAGDFVLYLLRDLVQQHAWKANAR